MSTRRLRRDEEAPIEAPTFAVDEAAPPAIEVDPIAPVGRRFGRYHVGYELASGGMATVYLAALRADAGFEKVLALKCIHPHLSKDPRFVRMFMDEARIASRADHPNVVQIFDFGLEEDTYFLAMEYLVGESFGVVLQRARQGQSSGRARAMLLRALVDACEGLHAVHELRNREGEPLGVVHRDVSPQNLLLTFDGIAKLLDFGIASARDQLHRTQTGEIKGNLPYIAPEQIRGRDVDRRADLWSVGVMLWEALTGTSLFKRSNPAETLYAVAHDMVRRVDALDPDIPRGLADVVATALQRDPGERWKDARTLGRAIQEAAAPLGPWPSQADLSEWLQALFPGGRERTQERMQKTRALLDAPQTTVTRRRRWIWVAGLTALFAGGIGAAVLLQEPPVVVETSVAQPPEEEEGTLSIPIDEVEVEPEVQVEPEAMRARRASRMRARTMRASMTMQETGEPGRVALVTPDGWANVSWQGRSLGVTPLTTTMPAGTHTLTLRPFGRGPNKRVRVTVESGGTVRRSVRVATP